MWPCRMHDLQCHPSAHTQKLRCPASPVSPSTRLFSRLFRSLHKSAAGLSWGWVAACLCVASSGGSGEGRRKFRGSWGTEAGHAADTRQQERIGAHSCGWLLLGWRKGRVGVSGQAAGAKGAPPCVRSPVQAPRSVAAAHRSPTLPAVASASATPPAWRRLSWLQRPRSALPRHALLRAGA